MKKRNALATITALFIIAFTARTVYGLYNSPEPWPMFKHDLDHTGYATSAAPSSNATLWSTSGVYSLNSPIVADGRVIAFSYNKLYAFDETTGVKLWESFTFTGSAQGNPAHADGRVYASTNNGYVYCTNASTGTKIWEYQITSASGGVLTTTVANGKVYVTTYDGHVYAMNATTSLPLPGWEFSTGGSPIYSSPAIHGDMMYFGCNDDKVRALNVSSDAGPSLVWQFVTKGDVKSSPCYGDGKIFIGTSYSDHSLIALDATTTSPIGECIWNYTLDSSWNIDNSPSYFDETVYFGAGSKAYALNANALPGNYTENSIAIKKWSTTIENYPTSVAVADGKVFIGTAGTKLYALDTTTGFILWSYNFGSYPPETPIVADGKVFTANYYGLYCFGTDYPALNYYYTVAPLGHSYEIELVIHNATPSMTMDIDRLTTQKKINYTIATAIPNTYTTCNITIPNEMLGGPYTVRVDGGIVSHTLVNTTTHSSLYFANFHTDSNTHIVEITGTTVIPEFPMATMLMTLLTVTLAAAMLARKRTRN